MCTSANKFLKWEASSNCPPARGYRTALAIGLWPSGKLILPPHHLCMPSTYSHLQGEEDHVPLSAQYLQGDSVLRCIRVSVGCQHDRLIDAYQSFKGAAQRHFGQNVLNIKTFHSEGFRKAGKMYRIHNSCLSETIRVATVQQSGNSREWTNVLCVSSQTPHRPRSLTSQSFQQ